MTLLAYLDSFAVSTGTVGTTQARTGYGFKPKSIIVWGFGLTSASSTWDPSFAMNGSIGFATSTSNRGGVSMLDTDGDTTPSPNSARFSTAAYSTFDSTGILDVQSFDSDGVTFIVDEQFSVASQVFVLALGGPALTHASVVELAGPALSDIDIGHTGVGFQPNAGLFLFRDNANGVRLSVGAAAGRNGSIVNKASRIISSQNDPTVTAREFEAANCFTGVGVTGTIEGSVESWDSDGLTVHWGETGAGQANLSAFTVVALLLRTVPDDALSLHQVNTKTDTTTDIPITGLQTAPAFGLAVGSAIAADTLTAGAMISCGAFAGATHRSFSYYSVDDVGTSDVRVGIDYEDFYRYPNSTATRQMRVFSTQHTGITFRMSDADAVEVPIWVLLGAAKPQVRGAPIFF